MPTHQNILVTAAAILIAALSSPLLHAQAGSTPNAHAIPFIDGGIGACTADFTINDNAGKPIYDAQIKVHLSYGAFGVHKLDLQVGTNIDGKARFTGLPSKSKQGFFFQASKGDSTGSAFDDPTKTCNAQFTVALEKQAPSAP